MIICPAVAIIHPSNAPATTWVGVCPKSSRNGLVSAKGCSAGSSQTIWFSTAACFPACNLTPEASYITTLANIVAVAKRELPKPSWKPIATDNAVTVAECDDGMPPEPISCLGSHLFSLYLPLIRTSAHQNLLQQHWSKKALCSINKRDATRRKGEFNPKIHRYDRPC